EKSLDTPVFRLIRFAQKVLTESKPPLELFSLEEKVTLLPGGLFVLAHLCSSGNSSVLFPYHPLTRFQANGEFLERRYVLRRMWRGGSTRSGLLQQMRQADPRKHFSDAGSSGTRAGARSPARDSVDCIFSVQHHRRRVHVCCGAYDSSAHESVR